MPTIRSPTNASTTSPPLVYYVDVDFEDKSNMYIGINGTVMHAGTTPPVFSSSWRHFALTYDQPYLILCNGAGFEVQQATNYDVSRDFTIAMTFAAADVTSKQGLLYKGTGSDVTSPQLDMSYRVEIDSGDKMVTLDDSRMATSTISYPSVQGRAVQSKPGHVLPARSSSSRPRLPPRTMRNPDSSRSLWPTIRS